MRFKEKLAIMNELGKRVEHHNDHGDEDICIPWDVESKALVNKLGYTEEQLAIEKYIKNETYLDLGLLAYFVFDGSMWNFGDKTSGFHVDEKSSEREKSYKKAIAKYGIRTQMPMGI